MSKFLTEKQVREVLKQGNLAADSQKEGVRVMFFKSRSIFQREVLKCTRLGLCLITVFSPILILACSSPEPNSELTGTILTDEWFAGTESSPEGRDCHVYAQGNFRDLGVGSKVKIRNAQDEIIALGEVTNGIVENVNGQLYCVMRFSVSDIPSSNFYIISLGGEQRGTLTYTKEELSEQDWQVQLSLQ